MRSLSRMGLLAVLAASAYAQQSSRLRGEIHGIADPTPLRSFKKLCGRSDAIVEGVVETDASRMMPGRGDRIETDFWVAVSRVFKGSVSTPKIVVSELGGTFGELRLIMNFPLLLRGERYVLFLHADKRPGIPPVPGLPRYEADIFYGTFRVDEGAIRPFFRDPFGGKYTGLTAEAFAAGITAELKR